MGKYWPAERYDEVYGKEYKYHVEWKYTPYFLLWTEIVTKIKELPKLPLIELGCGTGQFAEMLQSENLITTANYTGYDFSAVAIDMARKKLNDQSMFFQKDITINLPAIVYTQKHIYICLETLEHLDDLSVLSKIPKDNILLCSVPDFDCENHLRHFDSLASVHDRYSPYIDFDYCYKLDRYYIFKGVKK